MMNGGEYYKMVNVLDCESSEFLKRTQGKKVFCFGAGKHWEFFLREFVEVSVEGIIDNYKSKEMDKIFLKKRYVDVLSLENFVNQYDKNCIIVITCYAFEEILKQLDQTEKLDGMDCYISLLLIGHTECTQAKIVNLGKQLIPKKIHYCWFGAGDLPKEYIENIETWRKCCPEYEIIRWDESNYDFRKNKYMGQAYDQKKWAFVSDYARVDILYQEGGIYLDTDVKMLKNMDKFLKWKMFCGFESRSLVAWGLGIGSICGHPILKEVMEIYDDLLFVRKDGTLNEIPCPYYQSDVLKRYGFNMNGQFQQKNGVAIYPKEFFAPLSHIKGLGGITDNSYTIHEYSASWIDPEVKERKKLLSEGLMRVQKRASGGKRSHFNSI